MNDDIRKFISELEADAHALDGKATELADALRDYVDDRDKLDDLINHTVAARSAMAGVIVEAAFCPTRCGRS